MMMLMQLLLSLRPISVAVPAAAQFLSRIPDVMIGAVMMTGAVMSHAVMMTGVAMSHAVMTDAAMRGVVMSRAAMIGAAMTGVVMTDAVMSPVVMIGAVMIGVVMEEERGGQILPLPLLLMSGAKSAQYTAILPVTAGGVMAVMTLMMMVTIMIRLLMLQPMASTPIGTPTLAPLITLRVC
jgi:hypothetical protein